MSLNDTHTADNYGRLILHKVNTSWIPPIKTKTLHRMFTYTDPPPSLRAVEFVIPTISLSSCGWICYTNDLIEVMRLNLLYQRSHWGLLLTLLYQRSHWGLLLNLLYQRSHWGRAVEFVIPTISLRSCGWICYTNDLIEVVRLNLLYQRSHWGRAVEFVIPTISLRSCGWICYTNDLIEVYCWICYTNDLIEVVRLNVLYQRSHWVRAVIVLHSRNCIIVI